MTIRDGVTLLLVSVSLAAFPFGACVQAQDVPKGDPVKGKQLWFADGCSYCHGTVGQGGRAAGPADRALPGPAGRSQLPGRPGPGPDPAGPRAATAIDELAGKPRKMGSS